MYVPLFHTFNTPTGNLKLVNSVNQSVCSSSRGLWQVGFYTGTAEQIDNEARNSMISNVFFKSKFAEQPRTRWNKHANKHRKFVITDDWRKTWTKTHICAVSAAITSTHADGLGATSSAFFVVKNTLKKNGDIGRLHRCTSPTMCWWPTGVC